jgi:uncharacterized protein YjbI with pentapeptide repeats
MQIRQFFQRLSGQVAKPMLLFDSAEKANEVAFMLQGEWDGCNGVIIHQCDEVALCAAANLLDASWCYQGDTKAITDTLPTAVLKERYERGERFFINANLRCANLAGADLCEINLSSAKLEMTNFSNANLTKAILTGASANEINLKQANLSQAQLIRTNLKHANLEGADLKGANLCNVCLEAANLRGADLRGAFLTYTNMLSCDTTDAIFDKL